MTDVKIADKWVNSEDLGTNPVVMEFTQKILDAVIATGVENPVVVTETIVGFVLHKLPKKNEPDPEPSPLEGFGTYLLENFK